MYMSCVCAYVLHRPIRVCICVCVYVGVCVCRPLSTCDMCVERLCVRTSVCESMFDDYLKTKEKAFHVFLLCRRNY